MYCSEYTCTSSVPYALYGSGTEEPHTAFSQAPLVEFCNLTDLTDLSIVEFCTHNFSRSISLFFFKCKRSGAPHGPTEEGPVQKPVLGGLFSSKFRILEENNPPLEHRLLYRFFLSGAVGLQIFCIWRRGDWSVRNFVYKSLLSVRFSCWLYLVLQQDQHINTHRHTTRKCRIAELYQGRLWESRVRFFSATSIQCIWDTTCTCTHCSTTGVYTLGTITTTTIAIYN